MFTVMHLQWSTVYKCLNQSI